VYENKGTMDIMTEMEAGFVSENSRSLQEIAAFFRDFARWERIGSL
jgi:hypothetical protein